MSKKRIMLLVAITLAAVVLAPYLTSRVLSPSRRVTDRSNVSVDEENPDDPTRLRVCCYNIAHGRGLAKSNWEGGGEEERVQRLKDIAKQIREIDADIVVLNEVDFDTSWSHGVNQAEYLAREAGYRYWKEQRNLDCRVLTWKWRFGNALLSRLPVSDATSIDLPALSEFESWVAGRKRAFYCDVAVGDQWLRVVAAHLSHRSEPIRDESAKMLVALAAESPHPVVIGGDLNSTPPGFPRSGSTADGNNAIATLDASELFQRRPTEPPQPQELTFSVDDPRSVIDWILIPAQWRFESYRAIDCDLSDHRPVVADVLIGD